MIFISLAFLILGLWKGEPALVVASGLFAISSSIDTFRYDYFRRNLPRQDENMK